LVYESPYGNTAVIGEAIAAGLRAAGMEVTAGSVSMVAPVVAEAFDLLVVGGPTHAHGMSELSPRARPSCSRFRYDDRQARHLHGLRRQGDRSAARASRLPIGHGTRVLPRIDEEPAAGGWNGSRNKVGRGCGRRRDRRRPSL